MNAQVVHLSSGFGYDHGQGEESRSVRLRYGLQRLGEEPRMVLRLLILAEVSLYREALATSLGGDDRFEVAAVAAGIDEAVAGSRPFGPTSSSWTQACRRAQGPYGCSRRPRRAPRSSPLAFRRSSGT